ncbi:F-box/LRR-repeat protein 12 [Austrofundulus limnaeus]|uniref:F-box/LRR-repeat protein 12 n=1 Tax=Austrofundulus limnaeus TaxID=52670 RepID=A0A2I4C4Y5_AUSLI|nr:PREDICTED: F-box/LRR-repeat protein 12 [Austrofundulus limnaeus]
MDEFKACNLDFCPENILIDVLSYLNVRELVRAGRVCKRWKRLVKDQRLWRNVDLTSWKGVTSRILWVLLRQFLGCGLRSLRLRGLLLSARGGTFLSEAWLKALSTKCPRLSKLYLLHSDLRSLPSCRAFPPSLRALELCSCELPRDFFSQSLPAAPHDRAEATSSASQQRQEKRGKRLSCHSGIGIEKLALNNVPSFTDQHLQSLTSWERLSRLELRDTFRVTADGLQSCAVNAAVGVERLSRLKFLEIGVTGRQGYPLQMASLGLRAGWIGLEELSLGGKEVAPGLFCTSYLKDLKHLCLWACTLSELQVVRSCRSISGLRRLEFLDVIFQPRQIPDEEQGGGEERQDEEEGGADDDVSDGNRTQDGNDPFLSLRRSLTEKLPSCALVFTNCTVQINPD